MFANTGGAFEMSRFFTNDGGSCMSSTPSDFIIKPNFLTEATGF